MQRLIMLIMKWPDTPSCRLETTAHCCPPHVIVRRVERGRQESFNTPLTSSPSVIVHSVFSSKTSLAHWAPFLQRSPGFPNSSFRQLYTNSLMRPPLSVAKKHPLSPDSTFMSFLGPWYIIAWNPPNNVAKPSTTQMMMEKVVGICTEVGVRVWIHVLAVPLSELISSMWASVYVSYTSTNVMRDTPN